MTGTRSLSISMMTLYIPHEISYMCGTDMAVRVTYECNMHADISGWLGARLEHLQCVCNGDAAALHQTIDIVHGLWPDA